MFSKTRIKNRMAIPTLLIVSFAVWAPGTAKPDETELRIGLARVKITPEEPIRMAGYASRNRPSEGVLTDLHAKAMAFEDGRGERAALDDLTAAKVSWGVGVTNIVMNRREFTERGIRLGFNPRGYVDRSVPVLRVESPNGKQCQTDA